MNDEKLVVVEYHNPKWNATECRPGWLREANQHILLIQEKIESIDLYIYTIIPRDFIRRIIQLQVQDK